jgi:hypothetical protein
MVIFSFLVKEKNKYKFLLVYMTPTIIIRLFRKPHQISGPPFLFFHWSIFSSVLSWMAFNFQDHRRLPGRSHRWLSETQRWKSQRKKIHRLAYRFSINFKIYRLAYGFLCVNHKGLAKVYRFLVRAFFSQDFKNP